MPIERTNESGRHVVEQLFGARRLALICSPYISSEYARKITGLAARGVLVKVLTSDKIVESDFRIREFFAEVKRKEKLDTLKTLVISHSMSFEHSKMYIIDDEYAVMGSANLTRAGMWENGETIDIYRTHTDVQLAREAFESAWKDALAAAFGNKSNTYQHTSTYSRQGTRANYQIHEKTGSKKIEDRDSIFDVIKRELRSLTK